MEKKFFPSTAFLKFKVRCNTVHVRYVPFYRSVLQEFHNVVEIHESQSCHQQVTETHLKPHETNIRQGDLLKGYWDSYQMKN